MNAVAALHNAAREYCESRYAHWSAEYTALVASGRHQITNADGSWIYTDASYRIFPRYNVLEAIRVEVERFVPSDFETIEVARGLLEAAAWSAESELTRSTSSIATAAMTEEREAFAQFVARTTQVEWSAMKVLPFRRVLGAPERDRLSHDFDARWGVWYGGCGRGMACSRSEGPAEGRADPRRRTVEYGHGADPEAGPLHRRCGFVGEDRRVDRRDGDRRCPCRDPTCKDHESLTQAAIAVARTVGMHADTAIVRHRRTRKASENCGGKADRPRDESRAVLLVNGVENGARGDVSNDRDGGDGGRLLLVSSERGGRAADEGDVDEEDLPAVPGSLVGVRGCGLGVRGRRDESRDNGEKEGEAPLHCASLMHMPGRGK